MSGRAARAKGAGAEREIVGIFGERGYDVHRTPHSGALEWMPGDITGTEWFIEVKRCETLRIGEWMRKAIAQAAGKVVLLIHRRSREEWYVTMRLEDFLELMER